MFGMSFSEITIILFVAVIALGPEKLPKAMVEIAKYIKFFKKTLSEAKESFDQEIKIAELKNDAKKYKQDLAKSAESVRKKLKLEDFDELKKTTQEVKASFEDIQKDINEFQSKTTQFNQNSQETSDGKDGQIISRREQFKLKQDSILKENKDV